MLGRVYTSAPLTVRDVVERGFSKGSRFVLLVKSIGVYNITCMPV